MPVSRGSHPEDLAGEVAPSTTGSGLPRGQRWMAFVLAAVTFLVFSPTLRNGFVTYDDPNQITGNLHLRTGASLGGLRWAFTSVESGNWHPLTWVVQLLTTQVFGLQPAGFHLASLLFHAAAAALLFLYLARATGRAAPSALAAGLFALHPLRVESVAWASELKDPLTGFFVMLTLLAHLRFAARPSVRRYLPVAAFCACALMAKPTAVVLPVLLLLADWWPLGRFTGSWGAPGRRRLLTEKLPLVALSSFAATLTFHAQDLVGAVRSVEHPAWVRVGNAAVSLVAYLGKMLWPTRLSFFYPHPGRAISPVAVVAATILLALLTALVVRTRRSHPYLAAGWLWYLVSVAPVAGVVQAGFQAMADRYTYLPLIGIAVAIAYGLADGAVLPAVPPAARWGGAAVLLCWYAALTPLQISLWGDSRTLYSHALALDPANWNAHLKLAELARVAGDTDGAVSHLRRAVELKPEDDYARELLGLTLLETGKTDEAVDELRAAVRLNQQWADAHLYLGIALLRSGRLDEAEQALRREGSLRPGNSRSLPYLGLCKLRQGNLDGAALLAAEYLRREPGSAQAHLFDGMVREARGDRPAAAKAYRRALARDPAAAEARAALERLRSGGKP